MPVNIIYRISDLAPIPVTTTVKGEQLTFDDMDGNWRSIKTSVDSITSSLTFNNSGTGVASGTVWDGTTAVVSYNSIGAPSVTGTNASGTWSINITGVAGSVDWSNVLNKPANLGAYIDPTTGNLIVSGGTTVNFGNIAGQVSGGVITAGSISAAKFAAGTEPVTIVDVLPLVKLTTTVFLTTDKKIYRWNGTAYVSSVPAIDITGQLTSGQIAPGSISVTSLAPGLTLIPVVTTNPVTYDGNIIFNSTTQLLYKWNGTAYVAMVNATDMTGTLQAAQIASLAASQITGAMSDSQLSAISAAKITGQLINSQISDAAITTAKFASSIEPITIVTSVPGTKSTTTIFNTTTGKLYRWNGTAYVATVASTDISGTLLATQIASLTAAQITGQLTDSQIAALSASKVTGQLVNSQIADAAINTAKFAAGIEPVTQVSAVPGTKSTTTIFNTTDGKLYRWNGTAYVSTVASTDISGTLLAAQIASLAASQITGQLTSTQIASITAAQLTGSIVGTQITDGAISTAKIAANAVTANEIAANTITASKIAANTITATQIAAGTITASQIAAGTILAGNIAASTITGGLIAANTITGSNIAADTITAGQIAAGAITASELAVGAVTAASIFAGTITSTQIAAGTITGSNIAATTITGTNLVANTITAGQIAANTITATQIAAGTITASQIAAGTITAGNIASNTITAGQIAAQTITATQIATDTITAGQIAAGAITASEVSAGAITTSKLFVSGRGPAINDDQFFTDSTAWSTSADVTFVTNGSLSTITGAQGSTYVHSSTGGSNGFAGSRKYSISPAQTYRLTANLYAGAGNNRTMFIYVRMFQADGVTEITGVTTGWGGSMAGYIYNGTPPTGVWSTQGGLFGANTAFPIPSTAAYMIVGVWFQYAGSGSSSIEQACQNLVVTTAVDNSLIVDGTIYGTKLVANSITAGQIAANTITASQIAAGTITAANIAGGTITGAKIAAGTIVAGNLVAGTITANEIAANTITAGQLAANTITAGQIAAGTITGTQIAAQTIYAGNLVAGTITATQIASATITGNLIAANTIQAASLVANSITAGQIAAGAITADRIDSRGLSIKDASGNVILSAGVPLTYSFITPAAGWLNANVLVGANNLMRLSGQFISTAGWSSNGSSITLDSTTLYGGFNTLAVAGSGGMSSNTVMRLKANTQYTVSAMVKGSSNAIGNGYDATLHIQNWRDEDTGNVHQETPVIWDTNPTTSWRRIYQTFITCSSANLTYVRFYIYPLAAGFTLNVGYIKLEEGNVPTDWTAAPEDVTSGINTAATTANWSSVASRPSNIASLSGAEAIQNAQISISGGTLNGIGTGSGTAVANSAITLNSDGSISGAGGGSVTATGINAITTSLSNAPSNIINGNITVDSGGTLQGIGSGAGTTIANNQISISSGAIQGIASGASGTYVSNNYSEGGVLHIYRPLGAAGSYSGTIGGAIKIRLPQGFTNTMLKFYIEIYEYNGGGPSTYCVGGYNYSANATWYNSFATYTGAPGNTRPIYFGSDGSGYCCVWIGAAGGSWSYPQIRVIDFSAGYSNNSESQWATGWGISFDTATATNVTNGVTTPTPGGALSGVNQINGSNVGSYVDTGSGLYNNQISISSSGTLNGAGGGTVTATGINAVATNLSNAPSSIINSNISISANGTLNGAGGGQVNLSGLGAGIFATLSQITAANITTYIAGAAIGSAQVGVLTANNIGVANLAAISANMGTITAGTLAAGTVFAGALSAATGTFSGSLSAATGTFAGSLSAATGTFAGSLSAVTGNFGNVTVGSSGSVSAGQSGFNSGTGFWLGGDGRFSIGGGSSSSNYLTWDGSGLHIQSDALLLGNASNTIAIGVNTSKIGSNNSFIGTSAGSTYNNGAASYNIIIGAGASASFSSGSSGSFNIVVGTMAFAYNTTATNNTIVGGYSGLRITSGNNNTLLGYQAGYYLDTGSNNVIIGSYTAQFGGAISNNIILSDGSATVRHLIDGSGNVKTTVPGTSTLYPDFSCRAWANFNGSLTTPSVRGSGNVSSIVRNTVGHYSVTFSTSLPDAGYSVTFGLNLPSSTNPATVWIISQSASGFVFETGYGGPTTEDVSIVCFSVLR